MAAHIDRDPVAETKRFFVVFLLEIGEENELPWPRWEPFLMHHRPSFSLRRRSDDGKGNGWPRVESPLCVASKARNLQLAARARHGWWKWKLRLETCKKNSKEVTKCNLISKDLTQPSCTTKIGNRQSQGSFHITHHGIWWSQTTCIDHLHKLSQSWPNEKSLRFTCILSVCPWPEVAIEVTPPRAAKTLSQTSFALLIDNDMSLGN